MARICMLAFTRYLTDSRVRREAEALAARGDEVDCICLTELGGASARKCKGVNLIPIPLGRYRGRSTLIYLAQYAAFFLIAFLLISALWYRRRYDLIQVHTMPDFMVFAALIPKMFGTKVILDVHDLMPELYASKFGLGQRHPLIKLITCVERRSIAFADRAIAVHSPHRDCLASHGSPHENISILLNLPDPRIFTRNGSMHRNGDGKFRLVYHGTISRRHGLEVALRAVKLARRQIPNLEFAVLGEGDDLDRLVVLADELGVADCVRFNSKMVALEQLPAHIGQADLGLVPILYDSFTRFMLPVKLMEYVRLGVPVICSRTETIAAYFDETMVRYFTSGNDVELADHIVELHNCPENRARLITNAESFNRKFSWEKEMRGYYDLIDSLCAGQEVLRTNVNLRTGEESL